MKRKNSRMWLSALLVICMVFGMGGTAFAGTCVQAEAAEEAMAAFDVLVDVLEQYGPDVAAGAYQYAEKAGCIDQLKQEIAALQGAVEEELENLEAEVESQAVAQMETVKGELQAVNEKLMAQVAAAEEAVDLLMEKKAALEEELTGLMADLQAADEAVRAEIQAAIDEVNKAIDEIERMIAEVEAAADVLNEKSDEIMAALDALDGKVAEIAAAAAEMAKVAADMAEASGVADEIYNTFIEVHGADVQAAYEAAMAAYECMQGIKDELLAANEMMEDAIEEAEALAAEIQEDLAALPGIIQAEAEAMADALAEAAAQGLADLDGMIREALMDATEEAAEALEALASDAAMALNAHLMEVLGAVDAHICEKAAVVFAAYKEAYIGAVTGEFTVDCDSKLVSIGDASAVNAAGESYTEKLAKALGEMNGLEEPVDYVQLAKAGLMAEDLMDVVLANAAQIADADMVTVSVDNNDFVIENVMASVLYGKEAEFDWAKYVTEEGVPYVEEALAEIESYLAEEAGLGVVDLAGMDEIDLLKAAMTAVESFAYSYVDYAWNYAQVLTAIHEINPEAQVVVVGMYNPMDDLVIADVEIGAAIDKIVELSDLYGLVYAMLVPNTTFVAVPDVETVMEATAPESYPMEILYISDLLQALTHGELVASEAGHEYIKDQILAAFTVCANGHIWGEGVVAEGENCQTAGTITYTCSVCGTPRVEAGPVGPHVAGEWTQLGEVVDGIKTEVKNCTLCGTELDRKTTNVGGTGDEPVTPPYYGGGYVSIQKPTIEASEGVKVELSYDGTKATITVEDGYILMDVELNGKSLGDEIYEVSGLKTGDVLKVTAMSKEDFAKYVKESKLVARSKMSKAKGKKAVKVYWFEKSGDERIYDLDFDGYQVFRSTKRFKGFGKKPMFTTERTKYWNTAIEDGVKYFYKVRGFVKVDGKKYYTDWSLKAWRTVE